MEITQAPPDAALSLPLPQHPAFAAALRALGRRAEVMTLRDGARRVAQVVMVAGPGLMHRIALALRGPVWLPDAAQADRIAALRQLGRLGLRMIEADDGADAACLRGAGYLRLLTPAHVAELDLTGSAATRRAAMDGKWRNRLKRAEAAGLRVRELVFCDDAAHWLLGLEAAQQRARRYRGAHGAVALGFARANPGMARLFLAEAAGERIAAMLFLRHGPVATYQIGWTGDAGRRLCAHNLLLARAADWLAAAGHVRLDLGTVDTEGSPGLARFKIGAGAALRPLGGSWLRLPGF